MKCSEGCITNLIWQMIQIKIFQESTEQILINSMHLELDVWPMLDTAVGVKEASTLRRCWAWSCSPEALGSRGLCPSSWLQPPASLEMGVGARAPSHHDDAPCTQAGSEGRVTPETEALLVTTAYPAFSRLIRNAPFLSLSFWHAQGPWASLVISPGSWLAHIIYCWIMNATREHALLLHTSLTTSWITEHHRASSSIYDARIHY